MARTKPAAPATPSKAAAKRRRTPAGSLRIRMYRVGFGDFFLVTAFTRKGPEHILIDCGVTGGRTGRGDIHTLKAAVAHMAAETGHRLALIIATHRHADHIIGFSRCESVFAAFKGQVGAIWMPCWEQAYTQTLALQARIEQVARGLRAVALAGDRDAVNDEILGIADNALGITGDGPGGGTNARSLALLKQGLGVTPVYLAHGDAAPLPRALVDAGFEAEILGPPPIDHFDALKLENLAQGVGQYLGAAADGLVAPAALAPFGPPWWVGAEHYPPSAFREWAPRAKGRAPDQTQRHRAELEAAVRGATPQALLLAARELDRVLNNQSLVVLLTWQGRKLLFAGDAQAGNWLYWLHDEGRTDPVQGTQALSAPARDLLSSLAFYKAGHHGSTNATPVAAVQAMGNGFVTMCSTEAGCFGTEGNDSEVPRGPLITARRRKSVVLRSDDFAARLADHEVPAAPGAPARPPRPAQGRIETGDLHVDYLL
jgi:beta-lactamase superfamily II metal-dependent hydrolase